eukprot:521173_1
MVESKSTPDIPYIQFKDTSYIDQTIQQVQRKYNGKDLSLRIPNEKKRRKNKIKKLRAQITIKPLKYGRGNRCGSCCLCCTDIVSALSFEERVIKLVCGYVRENTRQYTVPQDIYVLCIIFAGKADNFDHQQLTSMKVKQAHASKNACKDILHCCYLIMICKPILQCVVYCCVGIVRGIHKCVDVCVVCLGCCVAGTCADFCDAYCIPWWRHQNCECYANGCCCRYVVFGFWMITLIKDIVALVINFENNCDIIKIDNENVQLFGIGEWMWIGPIVHICELMYLLCAVGIIITDRGCSTWYYASVCGCFLCGQCFQIAWVVFGFLLFFGSEIKWDNVSEETCGIVILAWTIWQTYEIVFFCVCVVLGLRYINQIE